MLLESSYYWWLKECCEKSNTSMSVGRWPVGESFFLIIEKDQQSGRPEHICYCAAGRESRPRFDLITTFIYFFVTISVNEVTFIEDEK